MVCLSFFNYRIYWVMRRRRQLVNRPYNATANANNEKNKKPVASSAATVLNQVWPLNFFLFPFLLKKKSMTPSQENAILLCSSQQLPRLRLGPLKSFLS